MKRPRPVAGLVVPIVSLACAEPSIPTDAASVVTSIFPVASVVRSLAPEGVRVDVLLPAGASPAVYEPEPRRLAALSGARLFVLVGAGLDGWAESLAEATPVMRLTEDMELDRSHVHEGASGNPHVWLDPLTVRDDLVPRLRSALTGAFPSASGEIADRSRRFEDSLSVLHREIENRLSPFAGSPLVSSHGAWTYFARRYGLRELEPIHPSPGREPSPRDFAELVAAARRAGVRVVFAEPQLGRAAAEALAGELDGRVLELDPLGGPNVPGRDDYLSLMRFNVETLVQGLSSVEPGA